MLHVFQVISVFLYFVWIKYIGLLDHGVIFLAVDTSSVPSFLSVLIVSSPFGPVGYFGGVLWRLSGGYTWAYPRGFTTDV